jgi:hypothetical protein
MQGIEYLIWKHLECDDYNRFLSFSGMILNHLQPLILSLLTLYFNLELDIKNKNLIIMISFIYLCIIIPYSIQFMNNKDKHCTLKNKDNHLLWNWNLMNYTDFVYLIFLLTLCSICLLGFPKIEYGIYGALVAIISHITSSIFYSGDVFGALWCYYVAYFPIIYYFLRMLQILLIK